MSKLSIDPEFQALIPALTSEERQALKRSLLEWGCFDPLKVWADHGILIDGHNRLEICTEYNLPYAIVEIELDDRADAIAWIIQNQLARRNLTPEQLIYFRGLQYQQQKKRSRGGGDRRSNPAKNQKPQSEGIDSAKNTAQVLADQHGISRATIERDAQFAKAVDALDAAVPGTKNQILNGQSELTRAQVVNIARVTADNPEQRAQMIKQAPQRKIRMANDYYPTPDPIITALLDQLTIEGTILEPCAGHGAIAAYFPGCLINEPYPTGDFQPQFTADATDPAFWSKMQRQGIDWVVTNPPYGDLAMPIVSHAIQTARVGVAMLLRLNWLEPCRDRAQLLQQYADHMTHVIALSPRPRFRADTNSSDNITVAWVVWQQAWSWQQQGIDCPFQFLANWRCASDPLTVPDRTARLHERMR